MGHRALVAYELADGGYYVVYTRWGANRLAEDDFDRTRPFGGDYLSPARPVLEKAMTDFYAATAGARDVAEPAAFERYGDDDLEDDERAFVDSLSTIVTDRLDFLEHEAFLVVDADWTARRYRTLWTNVVPATVGGRERRYEEYETVGEGLLYRTPHPRRDDAEPASSAIRERREAIEREVEDGERSIESAQAAFRDWLVHWDVLDPERVPPFSPYRP